MGRPLDWNQFSKGSLELLNLSKFPGENFAGARGGSPSYGLTPRTAQDFEEAILTNFFIYKLTGPFILISLLKLISLLDFLTA